MKLSDLNRDEIFTEWTNALCSGKYKQGSHGLCNGTKHCCLAVLLEVLAEKGVVKKSVDTDGYVLYDGERDLLPEKVAKFMGMTRAGDFDYKLLGSLVDINDIGRFSFSAIATIIKTNIGNFERYRHDAEQNVG